LLKVNCAGLDVDLREAKVGAENGRSFISQKNFGREMGYRVEEGEMGRPIEILSIASILAAKPAAQFRPFLLKLDVEGSEKSVFEGDTGALNSFPLILMEPHSWMLPGRMVSQPFFRFHLAADREFCMKHENIVSIVRGATETYV
jgi:hypothetical protein